MDVHTKAQRSYNMSRIRSKNTKPELVLFTKLKDAGLKFRKHYDIPGKPDAVFPEEKLAIFIDGEYWHGKSFSKWKEQLSEFWLHKIDTNIKRDKTIRRQLRRDGWTVLRIWGRNIVKEPDIHLLRIKTLISKQQKMNCNI